MTNSTKETRQSNSSSEIQSSSAPESQNEQILQLVCALHASLDIPTILEAFSNAAYRDTACTGIKYSNSSANIDVIVGKQEEFAFQYHLNINDSNFGHISFFSHEPFTKPDILALEDLLIFLINPLKNALEHLNAMQSALHDNLTGLGNRNALLPVLRRDVDLAKRHDTAFSILAFDIDFFKRINDTYGHLAGDAYLKAFADCLRDTLRESDMIYRIGGEEFIAILANTDNEGARILAERLCSTLAELVVSYKNQDMNTTCSIGIASLHRDDDDTTLLERADKALYAAKHAGRNQVCG